MGPDGCGTSEGRPTRGWTFRVDSGTVAPVDQWEGTVRSTEVRREKIYIYIYR